MWTEPERVSPGSWISSVYPQYVYQPDRPDATTVVDLGNPEALLYLKQFVSAAVEKYKLSVWRVDFNTNPAIVWARTGDAHTGPTNKTAPEFRRGMNEAGYVRGLYDLWVRGILSFLWLHPSTHQHLQFIEAASTYRHSAVCLPDELLSILCVSCIMICSCFHSVC